MLYGGAVGGGKSAALCTEGIQLSLDYPGNVGYLCRHELSSFRRTTLMTLERFLPDKLVRQHHQTECFIRLENGSMIYYGGLEDSDNITKNRIKSMDLGWFGIDQAEETSESNFFLLASRLRLNLPKIRYKGLLTANPAPGWVKHRFIEQKLEDHVFIQALPKDNPYLPPDYESNLRKLYPEELVKQLLEGDWDVLEAGNYLFKYADIKAAIDRETNEDKTTVLGVDLARFGDDSSVACIRQGSEVVWLEEWAKTDLMTSTGKIINLIQKFTPDAVNVDVIGLGAGVVDRLKEQKFKVNGVNVGEAATDKLKYANLRAEAYWQLADRFQKGEISIPDDLGLLAQLSSIKYKFDSHGRLQIEAKEDMKKRGMKSPDKADALVLAFMESPSREVRIRWL